MISKTNFYKDHKWENLRRQALHRDRYTDRYLARYGKMRSAEIVHHIFPVNEFPQYRYCLWNLISVTRATHNTFHDRDSNALTETGQEVLRRLCKKMNMEIPEQYREKKEEKHKIKYLHIY